MTAGSVLGKLQNKQFLKPKSIEINYTHRKHFLSRLELTAKLRSNYNSEYDGFETRFYVGYNLLNKGPNQLYNFNLKGQGSYGDDTLAVNNDFLYDQSILGRNTYFPNFLAQQLTNTYAGFKINTNNNASNLLFASNFKLELPKLPIGIFLDVASFDERKWNKPDVPNFIVLYNSGLFFRLMLQNKEILGIYLPLKFSEDISDELGDIKLLQKITFVLNISEINPFKIKKNLRP